MLLQCKKAPQLFMNQILFGVITWCIIYWPILAAFKCNLTIGYRLWMHILKIHIMEESAFNSWHTFLQRKQSEDRPSSLVLKIANDRCMRYSL